MVKPRHRVHRASYIGAIAVTNLYFDEGFSMPTCSRPALFALALGIAFAATPSSAAEPELNSFFFEPSSVSTSHFGPAVASDAAGNFVMAWLASDGVNRAQEIRAYLFNAAGEVLRGPLPVSVRAPGNLSAPVVARTPSGFWVVAWVRTVEGTPRRYFLEMRRYRPLGLPSGPPLQVNADPTVPVQSPALAIDREGRVAVAWDSFRSQHPEGSIWLRRYGPLGRALGPEQPVAVSSGNSVSNPALAYDQDGALLIAWRVFSGLNEIHVAAGLLPRPGDPVVPPFLVDEISSGFQTQPRLIADPRGGFMVLWDNCLRPSADGDNGSCSVRARRLNARAEVDSPELQLTPEDGRAIHGLAASFAHDGTLALSWDSAPSASSPPVQERPDLRVRLFDGNGEPLTDGATLGGEDWRGNPTLSRTRDGFALFFEEHGSSPDGLFGTLVLKLETEDEVAGF